ncbi:hypothetical protein OSTOST_09720 [Ostertagia ostertagi]
MHKLDQPQEKHVIRDDHPSGHPAEIIVNKEDTDRSSETAKILDNAEFMGSLHDDNHNDEVENDQQDAEEDNNEQNDDRNEQKENDDPGNEQEENSDRGDECEENNELEEEGIFEGNR